MGPKIFCCFLVSLLFLPLFSLAQQQDFESNFRIVNHPEEFLPFWSGNDVRATAARIFQANGEGIGGSRALAVQPISTFDGVLIIKLNLMDFQSPKIAFFAKSRQNGTGNRPVLLFASVSRDRGTSYSTPEMIGNATSFPNTNTSFALYEWEIPDDFHGLSEVWLRLEVRNGAGTGSTARFFMDNFGIFEAKEQVDPIRVKGARLLNPYTAEVVLDRAIEKPTLDQISAPGFRLDTFIFPSDTVLELRFREFLPSSELSFFLRSLQAKEGTITDEVEVTIDNRSIKVGEILAIQPDRLWLEFSQPFSPASASQTAHFRVNGVFPREVVLADNGYALELLLAQELQLNRQYVLEVISLRNAEGALAPNHQLAFWYHDGVEELRVTSKQRLEVIHDIPVVGLWDSRVGFSVEDHDFRLDHAFHPTDRSVQISSGQVWEENLTYELRIPPRLSERGGRLHGSQRAFIWDITPPALVKVSALDTRRLLLVFSEDLDPVFAMIPGNYRVEGQAIQSLSLPGNGAQVVLQLPFDLRVGQSYKLEIEQIADLRGNFLEPLQMEFTADPPSQLGFKELLINEVMPAPRAGRTLPNVEYVELLNNGNRPISIGGFQLANSRRRTVVPEAILLPGEYLLLVPRNQVGQFVRFGRVLGLANWPTLTNSADRVVLIDAQDRVLDSLVYNSASFGSSAVASGGFSLEIVNPDVICNLSSNLRPSIAEDRGTPGRRNSVFEQVPDQSPFTVIRGAALGNREVKVRFSRIVQQDFSMMEWSFEPAVRLQAVRPGDTPDAIVLVFAEDLLPGQLYKGKVGRLRDCTGKIIDPAGAEVSFVIPLPAEKGDIGINEVLFNPRTGAPKFVEIYNASSKFIDLKDWKLANKNTAGEIANRRTLFGESMIIAPFSFLVFTTDSEKLKTEYPKGDERNFIQVSTLPSYPISSGNVVLLDPEENLVEIFSYTDRMHHRLLRETRGVSLERLSHRAAVDDPSNWQSASASSGFATPGLRNSQVMEDSDGSGIQVTPKVFVPEGPGDRNFAIISYRMDRPGKSATLRIYSLDGLLVRDIVQNAIWGAEGFYLWDGTDVQGRKVRPGYYIVWAEVFDLDGSVKTHQQTVVVGTLF